MPYFTSGDPIGPNRDAVTLDDFPSSLGASLGAAFGSTFANDPAALLDQTARLARLNDGPRLDQEAAQAAVKAAGVRLDIPDSGYTQPALNLLIQRKQDDAARQSILDRAPVGVVPGTMRFAAHLAGGIVDPLNIAASFIPAVGEARAASLLANAGESIVGRSIARAGIGAVEGAAGATALEAPSYFLHSQLQDDYSMADALTNIAFGGAMGASLHVAGGAIGDALRAAPHPAARFVGMSADDVQTALNFERERVTMTPEDQARALQSFTPETRRALGEGDVQTPLVAGDEPAPGGAGAVDSASGEAASRIDADTGTRVFQPDVGGEFRSPLAAEDMVARISPEMRETAVRGAVADFAQGRVPDVDSVVRMDPAAMPASTGSAIDAAVVELQAQRADLLGDAGGLAQRGVIRETRQQLKEHLSQAPDVSDEALRARAVEIKGGWPSSYKASLATARKELDQRVADHEATAQRLQGIIDGNARAQRAVQAVGEIDRRIDELIRSRPLVDLPAPTLDDVRAAALRQAQPERISVGDFFAARAEEQRLKGAGEAIAPPVSGSKVRPVDNEFARATDALQATAKNLEHGGVAPARLQSALDEMKPYDDAIADAKNLGNALRAAALCGLRT